MVEKVEGVCKKLRGKECKRLNGSRWTKRRRRRRRGGGRRGEEIIFFLEQLKMHVYVCMCEGEKALKKIPG